MNMDEYLESIKYAVEQIIELIHKDQDKLAKLLAPIEDKHKEAESKFGEASVVSTEDERQEMLAESNRAMRQMDRLIERNGGKIENLTVEIAARANSYNILSGTLLHFAKQAISMVHEKPYEISEDPNQRKSGNVVLFDGTSFTWDNPFRGSTEELRVLDLIVAARNQYEHYETGLYNNPRSRASQHNINVFKALSNAHPSLYECITTEDINDGKPPVNYAGKVVTELLNWNSFDKFKNDLMSIN